MWRRDRNFIHLYDKPLHRRLLYGPRYPASKFDGTPVLWCSLIAFGTVAFFWVYSQLSHHDTPFATVASQRTKSAGIPYIRHEEPPAPDMNSPAVLRANADVPNNPASVGEISPPEKTGPQPMVGRPRPSHTNKIARAKRKPVPSEAANAFGAEPRSFRSIFGGF
jgi:hypothetical protein